MESGLTICPAYGEAWMTVPGDVSGGGAGDCVRKRGWMKDWSLEFALRMVGRRMLPREDVSELGDMGDLGDCMGDSGSGSCSGAMPSSSGKGPSSGWAGETGRLPGMVSNCVIFVLDSKGLA